MRKLDEFLQDADEAEMHALDIPAFLVIPAAERKAGWKGRALTRIRQEAKRPWHLPKDMDATAYRLLREQEREREQRKQERLAALRALRK
ncbi:MAG TPA: hypothetical protein VF077_03865 [Nitrospiraceae bacterium]